MILIFSQNEYSYYPHRFYRLFKNVSDPSTLYARGIEPFLREISRRINKTGSK